MLHREERESAPEKNVKARKTDLDDMLLGKMVPEPVIGHAPGNQDVGVPVLRQGLGRPENVDQLDLDVLVSAELRRYFDHKPNAPLFPVSRLPVQILLMISGRAVHLS